MNYVENLQVLPMGSVRHFRRIRKNDTLFLRMCVFCRILVNLLENVQILPLGNVRHFRRIRKDDVFVFENVRFTTLIMPRISKVIVQVNEITVTALIAPRINKEPKNV